MRLSDQAITRYEQGCLILGFIGMIFSIAGLLSSDLNIKATFFCIGSFIMLTMAILNRKDYFIYLQLIVFIGSCAYFLPFPHFIKAILPFLFFIILFPHYKKNISFKAITAWIGLLGILFLSLGYALSMALFYGLGSAGIGIRSLKEYLDGNKPAIIWFFLNTLFVLILLLRTWHLI